MTRPTLQEVARAAGVSTASASRALNGGANVTEGLASRIRAAATRLGYLPNLSARALATRQSGLVGMLTGGFDEPLKSEIVMACEYELAAAGFGLIVSFAGSSGVRAAAEALLGRGAQAIIVTDIKVEQDLTRTMAARGVPCVALDPADGTEPSIGVGRREGAVLALRYLESLGLERFAVIASDHGLVDAVREALSDTSILVDACSVGAARAGMRRWRAGDGRATGIICSTDAAALLVLRECACEGIPVPQRMSLVGFGDSEFARHSYPALSTIRVATADVGRQLAETVLGRIDGRDYTPPRPAVKLVARETTAPPSLHHSSLAVVPRET